MAEQLGVSQFAVRDHIARFITALRTVVQSTGGMHSRHAFIERLDPRFYSAELLDVGLILDGNYIPCVVPYNAEIGGGQCSC